MGDPDEAGRIGVSRLGPEHQILAVDVRLVLRALRAIFLQRLHGGEDSDLLDGIAQQQRKSKAQEDKLAKIRN